MTAPTCANPEIAALDAQWWKDWWAQDFSWDGLKAHIYRAFGDHRHSQSLRDYWAAEEAHLIPEPGTSRLWTRVHCPFVFADGSPSPKASWSKDQWRDVHDAITARLITTSSREDDAAFLRGAVLAEFEFREAATGVRLLADHMYMRGDCLIWHHEQITFNSLIFRNAWLGGMVIVGPEIASADFSGATFAGEAVFEACTFHNHVTFAGARFLDRARFKEAKFPGNDFEADSGDFSGAQFSAPADFSEATFGHHAQFTGAQFAGPVDFFGVRFLGRALFDTVQCLDDIGFYKTAFVRRLTINDARFYGRVNLEGATDGDPIAQSPQGIRLYANVEDSQPGLTGTLDASQGPTERSFRSLPKLHARRAIFFEDANISNRDLLSPSTFREAQFCERARFHGSDIHANVNFHGAAFRKALGYVPCNLPKYPDALLHLRFRAEKQAANFAAWKKAYLKSRIERRGTDFTADGYFDSLEASFRTLKQMMEDRRDRVREGEFFNLELRARRKRTDVPWWERVASYIYWLISDYGNSIFRPLLVMLALFAGLSLVYFSVGDHENLLAPGMRIDPSHLYSALGFSWGNVFSPFSVLDPQRFTGGDAWTRDLVLNNGAGFSLFIKVVASLQSLLTLTLAFLAGLAGRRRFQIN